MEIKFIDTQLEDFIESLSDATGTRVMRMIDYLEQHGHQIRMPYTKKISKDLFELRIQGAEQVRIFFTYHRGKIVLLHAFIKKSQRIPLQEIRMAEQKFRSLR